MARKKHTSIIILIKTLFPPSLGGFLF
ncbi:Stage V sporulation protein M (plasmid) [Escherichia coli]|uniref:Uncharacterized protein n=1 Tax=Escherichia coli TaxID=562 RepID=H1ZXT5_ECOLX|nr:Stage V sporulation protein M [Escherichia coli]CCA64339.1 hypothetical protein MM3_008 [Escherichia coli]